MTELETQGNEFAAPRPSCIVHAVCHECPHFEELIEAPTAVEAKGVAILAAVQHARDSGHLNVEHELLTAAVEVGEE